MKLLQHFTLAVCLVGLLGHGLAWPNDQPPNLVVIFVDDLGFTDVGAFGSPVSVTPHLDRLARQGRRFTDFVVASAVCSASRAALLTGCYHERVSISEALPPSAKIGIHADETTLAEIARGQGYATACLGKWHLGHLPPFLPVQHGFDTYFGLPYSNDMWPFHPDFAHLSPEAAARKRGFPPLPLIENDRVLQPEVTAADQATLTRQYTERAIEFLRAQRERPFFLYVAHSMVHVPLFADRSFQGSTGRGIYADVLADVDASVGRIVQTIDELGLGERTWIVFTSDNGPWLSYGNHAGSAYPFREGKGTAFEGGVRVPTLMRWPGKIPANTSCHELASTIDILPTFANWIGAPLPSHPIDGKDIRDLVTGVPDAASPHTCFYYYYGRRELQAVRDHRWKLILPHTYRTLGSRPGGRDGSPSPYTQVNTPERLYDLARDIGETCDVHHQHPDIVARLRACAERARDDLGDRLTNREGSGVRPAGQFQANDQLPAP